MRPEKLPAMMTLLLASKQCRFRNCRRWPESSSPTETPHLRSHISPQPKRTRRVAPRSASHPQGPPCSGSTLSERHRRFHRPPRPQPYPWPPHPSSETRLVFLTTDNL